MRQMRPQPPQFALLVFVLVSQPLSGLKSQLANPAVHIPIAQPPAPQVAVALANAHARPQPRQFTTVLSGDSQPSPTIRLQSPKPTLQAPIPHIPLLQTATARGGAQVIPQAPQC